MPESQPQTTDLDELLSNRRANLSDAHVTDYDKLNEDGDKIRIEKLQGPQGMEKELERNYTHLFQDAPSRTGTVSLLVLEAELADDGKDLANPHIPTGEDTLRDALNQMETKGLTPAWEQ